MKRMKYLVLGLLLTVSAFADKPRIIFDTDITGDVDDVLALAMCHTLADRGACELLGCYHLEDQSSDRELRRCGEHLLWSGPISPLESAEIPVRRSARASISSSRSRPITRMI